MSFKDQIRQDLDAVFLNVDEFAELHRIEGKEIPVVVDNDQLVKLKQGQILGLVEADLLLMGSYFYPLFFSVFAPFLFMCEFSLLSY